MSPFNKPIPSDDDWLVEEECLDLKYAREIFQGKSIQEVQEAFHRSVIERADELRYLPKVPFQYYIFAFKLFLETGNIDQIDLSDAASCYLRLIEHKLDSTPEDIVPVIEELIDLVNLIADNQKDFYADKDIYGDFPAIRDNIVSLMKKNLL